MMIQMPATPKAENVQLGEGVLIYNFNPDNWEDDKSILFGATRGGGTYTVEPTNKPIRFDGDRGENTKGMKRKTEWVITIVSNALELHMDNLKRIMPGKIEQKTGETTPNYKKYRPKIDYEDEDYQGNIAYVTKTHAGGLVAYVIENALGDGSLAAAFEDKEEVVSETTFTAHFDPNNMQTVPTYIVHYDNESENGGDVTGAGTMSVQIEENEKEQE